MRYLSSNGVDSHTTVIVSTAGNTPFMGGGGGQGLKGNGGGGQLQNKSSCSQDTAELVKKIYSTVQSTSSCFQAREGQYPFKLHKRGAE